MLVWEFNQRIKGLDDRQEIETLNVARIQHAIFTGQLKKAPSIWALSGIDKPKAMTNVMDKEEIEADIKRKTKAFKKANGSS